MSKKKLGFESTLIHGDGFEDSYGSPNVPIYQTSTFTFKSADHGASCFSGEEDGYIYTRLGNPTIASLEHLVANLENGYGGIAVSSGMGAVNTIYMGLLSQGDHMISSAAVYGPSRSVMEKHWSRFGVESTYVNTADVDNIKAAIKPNTKVLFIESPANPTMDITDIREASALAKKHGIITVVDNTFCSPHLQKPLDLGADVVFHSMTKFLNGHADVVAGIIVAKEKEMYDTLRPIMVNMGVNMDPHQAYLVIRGIKTLAVRIDRAQDNAMQIAEYLENHDKVEWVTYPGLASHPQHELAKKQMKGSGTMLSFGLKGGFKAGKVVMDNVEVALLAVSLGGVETLIQHPASMTHSKVSAESKQKAGITDGLVRYSVGIENVDDLIADLDQALSKV
ncbi:MAG: PLP-dependent aspartate aminotransferase family protein [Bacteroidales bacterium]|nr:PLP-dependent aspartate aminotransferase family protein [Bacteroidales bacterium]MCF8333770.1 PLP-dependent aspartate aminotransferase family protein [Bacteroidales bacterium]